MNPLFLGPVLEIGGKIIERLFPDPEKKAAAELELLKLTQSGDLQQVLAQLAINAKEAEHQSIFVAGWRPFVGWIGGFSFAYALFIHNILNWFALIKGLPLLPAIDTEILFYVLGGLLGLGGLRTVEKVKKVN